MPKSYFGWKRSCAVLEKWRGKMLGKYDYGRLGTGNNTLKYSTSPIDLGGKAKAISLGGMHSCAVLEKNEDLNVGEKLPWSAWNRRLY